VVLRWLFSWKFLLSLCKGVQGDGEDIHRLQRKAVATERSAPALRSQEDDTQHVFVD